MQLPVAASLTFPRGQGGRWQVPLESLKVPRGQGGGSQLPVSELRESPSGQGRGAQSPLSGSLDCPTGQAAAGAVERSQTPVTGFLGGNA